MLNLLFTIYYMRRTSTNVLITNKDDGRLRNPTALAGVVRCEDMKVNVNDGVAHGLCARLLDVALELKLVCGLARGTNF